MRTYILLKHSNHTLITRSYFPAIYVFLLESMSQTLHMDYAIAQIKSKDKEWKIVSWTCLDNEKIRI